MTRHSPRCSGPIDRRSFLKVGGLSLGALSSGLSPDLAGLLAAEAAGDAAFGEYDEEASVTGQLVGEFATSGLVNIVFDGDGTTDPAELVVSDLEGRMVVLEVRPLLDRVVVRDATN